MATMTPENETFAKPMQALVAALGNGPKPLASLPKECQSVDFLDYALSIRRVEFGRPDHSWVRSKGASESHDQRPIGLEVSKAVTWTSLSQSWEKSLSELLAEDKAMFCTVCQIQDEPEQTQCRAMRPVRKKDGTMGEAECEHPLVPLVAAPVKLLVRLAKRSQQGGR
jgi:hypothetical protein